MNISTPTAAATGTCIQAHPGLKSLLFKMDPASGAGLRIISGHPLIVNGVSTADTTGILLAALDPPLLLSSENAYVCKTATDGVAAVFFVMAVN